MLDRGLAVGARIGPGQQVLLDRQVLEAVPAFHHLDDAELDQIGRGQRGDAPSRELDAALGDLAALGAQQIGDRLERRGLAGAVGAEQRDDAALGNLERDALEHQDDVVVDDLDVVDDEQRPGHLRPGPLGRLGERGGHPQAPRCAQPPFAHSRGLMPFCFAYSLADASIIGRTTSFIGVIQSETNDHCSPSHCWTRIAWSPS